MQVHIVSQTQLRRTASSHNRKFELHRLTKIVSQTEVRRTASSHKRNLMHRLTNASSYRLTNAIVVELCCTIARTVLRRSRGGRPCGQMTGGVARVGVKRGYRARDGGWRGHAPSCRPGHSFGVPEAAVMSSDFLRRSSTDNALCCGLNVEPLFFRSEEHTTSSEPPFWEYIGHCPP